MYLLNFLESWGSLIYGALLCVTCSWQSINIWAQKPVNYIIGWNVSMGGFSGIKIGNVDWYLDILAVLWNLPHGMG
jgi:hypothetical protein